MAIGSLPKIKASTAAEVCAQCELSDEARTLLSHDMACERFLERLLDVKLTLDVLKFLAQALPKPEAVWWAGWCARSVAGASPPPLEMAALDAAERWSLDPQESHRRAAHQAAETAGLKVPAGSVALAAFVAEGSLGPENVKNVIPAPDYLTGRCVAGAVMLAGVIAQPEFSDQKYARFVEQGLAVARGEIGPQVRR